MNNVDDEKKEKKSENLLRVYGWAARRLIFSIAISWKMPFDYVGSALSLRF